MSKKLRSWLIPVTACLALVVILWIPVGIKVTGIMEEWLVIHDVEHGGPSDRNEDYDLFITTGVQRTRPLIGFAPIIAHDLTPDSFVGFNLVMMAVFLGKGIGFYLLLLKLAPHNKPYALLVALLFVVYPADGGLMTFRALSNHLSVMAYLLGTYLFLAWFQSGRRWALLGAWAAIIVSAWIYEAVYALIVFTPVLLILLEGRLNRRVVRASLIWFLAPLLSLLYFAFVFVQGESYQSWVLQRSGLNQPSIFGEMLGSMVNAYFRHFVEGWTQAINQLGTPYLGLGLVMVVVALAAGLLLMRQGGADQKRRYWILALIGFAGVGIGYAPFLITPYRQLDWRVYFYSSVGGAICVGSLVYLLILHTRLRRGVFAALMGVLIGLGTLRALNQHAYYADLGVLQQQLLHGVVEQVPRLKTEATIVVIDETGRYNSNWSLGASYLVRYALSYVYADNALNAVLCSFDPKIGQFVILPETLEQCAFTPGGITLSESGAQTAYYPYDQIVIVRYSDSGAHLLSSIPSAYLPSAAETVYNPNQFVDSVASPPHRFDTMFSLSG